MPSAIAGGARADGPADDSDLERMRVADLPVTARGPGLLALGAARIVQGRGRRVLVDGDVEEASAELALPAPHGPGQATVTLRRDAIGVRPLYYACSSDGSRLAWASRVTQLDALDWVDRGVDWEGVLDVVAAVVTEPSTTCILGIRQVPPGHRLEWRPGHVVLRREWGAEQFLWSGGRGPRDPSGEFAALLEAAVRRRWHDGTTLLLSGGLDSPAVAAAAVRQGLRPRTLSSVFPRFPGVDETERILAVRRVLGLEGELVEVQDRGLDNLSGELAMHGEPHIMPNHGHWEGLMRAAAERGCTSLMDGHDGDTALGLMQGVGRHLLLRPGLALKVLDFGVALGESRPKMLTSWTRQATPEPLRRLVRTVRPRPPSFAAGTPWLGHEALSRTAAATGPSDPWLRAQLHGAGPGLAQALGQLGRAPEHHGINILHPFADRELLEFLLALPPEAKYLGGRSKGLVREGFPELPSEVRDRLPKTLFDASAEAAHPLGPMAAEVGDPAVAVPGVDYPALRRRLDRAEPYSRGELSAMRRLALVHRFLVGRCATAPTA